MTKKPSKRQVLSLASSLSNFIGKERRQFLICDIESSGANFEIAARHAAIKGFTNFASKVDFIFELKDNKYQLNYNKVYNILNKSNNPVVICGFTFSLFIFSKFLKI